MWIKPITKEDIRDNVEVMFAIIGRGIILVILVGGIVLSVRSCQNESRFDPTTAARMYLPISSDTTKPKPSPKLINSYTLHGNDTLFNLLYLQIVTPGDVTPNQKLKLQNWVQQNLKQDTVTNK